MIDSVKQVCRFHRKVNTRKIILKLSGGTKEGMREEEDARYFGGFFAHNE